MTNKEIKSLVIGFCKCADCGWTNNKFNWHTYFTCPECGSHRYSKEGIYDVKGKEEMVGKISDGVSDGIFSPDGVSAD